MQESQAKQGQAGSIERQYPRQFFAAAVQFATRIAQITDLPIRTALEHYTGLYREVTGRNGFGDGDDPLWLALMEQIKEVREPEALTELLYASYLEQPNSLYVPGTNTLNARIFGTLGYVYAAEPRQARIHFFPQRSAVSALSSRYLQQRRADFQRLLLDLRTRHPEAQTIKSSTWLQNLPNYRNLFPLKFQARLKNIGASTYLGIWGQFVRADGSGNQARLAEFVAKLQQAQSVEQAIAAFPLPVLEAVGPLAEFLEEYELA